MNRVRHTFSSACPIDGSFLEALVLGRKELGEADLIVVLLTRDQGKIRALAKSARKSVRRFPFKLDLFIHMEVAIKERKEFPLLQEALLLSPFLGLREELPSYAMASLASEIASILSPERMPAQEIFSLLLLFFRSLDSRAAPPELLLAAFEARLLSMAGFGPEVVSCAACGEALMETGEIPFSFFHGGALCERCATGEGRIFRMDRSSLSFVSSCMKAPLEDLFLLTLPPGKERRLREVLTGYLCHQIGRRPNSLDFMERVL